MVLAPAFVILICLSLGIIFCFLLVLAVRSWNYLENSDYDAQEEQSGPYTIDQSLAIPWLKLYLSDAFNMVDRLVPATSLLKLALVPGRALSHDRRQMVGQSAAFLCPHLLVPAGCECVVAVPQSNVGALAGGGVDVKVRNVRGQLILRVCVEQCPGGEEDTVALGRRRLRLCSGDSDAAIAFCEEVGSHPPSYDLRAPEGEYFASITAGETSEGLEKMYVASSIDAPLLLKLSGDAMMTNVSVTDADHGCFCRSRCKKGTRFLEVVAGADVGLLVLLFLAVELLERRDGARGPARGAFDLDCSGKSCPGCGVVFAERDVCCARCGKQRDLSRGMSASSTLANLVGLEPRSVILDVDGEGPKPEIGGAPPPPLLLTGGRCSGCGGSSSAGSVCCVRCGRQREVSFSGLAKSAVVAGRRAAKTEWNGPGRGQQEPFSTEAGEDGHTRHILNVVSQTEAEGGGLGGQETEGRCLKDLISPRPQSCTSVASTELEERSTSESGSGHSSVESMDLTTPRQRWMSGTSLTSLGLAELQVPPPRWSTEDFAIEV